MSQNPGWVNDLDPGRDGAKRVYDEDIKDGDTEAGRYWKGMAMSIKAWLCVGVREGEGQEVNGRWKTGGWG